MDFIIAPIEPIKDWLLERGRCVGCGRELIYAQRERKNGSVLLTCMCRRVFVWDPKKESYRNAFLEDLVK